MRAWFISRGTPSFQDAGKDGWCAWTTAWCYAWLLRGGNKENARRVRARGAA